MNQGQKQVPPGISIPTLAELRASPDVELVNLHDEIAFLSRLSPSYILDELARREHHRQSRALLLYARTIAFMAGLIAVFTVVMLVAIMAILFGRTG